MTFDGSVREYLPRASPRTFAAAHARAGKPAEGRSTDLAAPLRRIVELVASAG